MGNEYIGEFWLDITNNEIITLKKSNFFLDGFETIGKHEVTPIDLKVITTAFIMVDYLNKKKVLYDANTNFSVPLKDFTRLWKIELSSDTGNLYKSLKKSFSKLRSNKYKYYDAKAGRLIDSGLFSEITYNAGVIGFSFPPTLISYLRDCSKFTWLWFDSVLKLSEQPKASFLFEFLCSFRNKGKKNAEGQTVVNVNLDKLKKILQDEGSNQNITDFKRRTLKKAVDSINLNSGLNIEVHEEKIGKQIFGFWFIVDFTGLDGSLANVNNPAVNNKIVLLTDNQIGKYIYKLTNDIDFITTFKLKGESDSDFEKRISNELRISEKVFAFYPYLQKLGFSSKKIEKIFSVASKIEQRDKEAGEADFIEDDLANDDRVVATQ